MNILVLSWRDPKHPLAGGAEQVMHEHMKGWIEAGHDVILFASYFKNGKRNEILDGVKIVRRGSQYLTVHIYAFFWYLFGKHNNFDIIVDQFHGWPFFTPLYVRKPKLAVIQELTRQVWFRYPLPFGLRYLLGPIGYFLEPLFFLFYINVKFMTGSCSAARELQTVGIRKGNITVVPHGVILKLPKRMPKKEKIKTLIFLGALANDKGIEDAIKAFGHLSKIGSFHFWIVGRGDEDYLKYLKRLVEELGISKKTIFFGFVSQTKKFELLSRAHLMVNPSIREGWGLVNIEANSVGTPVIGYKSPGLIDSIKNNESGVLCEENTPESLAKNVIDVLSDRERYKHLTNGSIKWSRNFNWHESKKKSLELIEKIVKH